MKVRVIVQVFVLSANPGPDSSKKMQGICDKPVLFCDTPEYHRKDEMEKGKYYHEE